MTATANENQTAIEQSVERIALDATRVCPDECDAGKSQRVLIVPWGDVRSESGDFIVDSQGSAHAIEAFTAHGTDLPVDYEHQTLGGSYASPNGQAPAAGWITALHAIAPDNCDENADATIANAARDENGDERAINKPGLWADVCWTDEAKCQLAARQYRYLSPVALVRKSDRRLIALHSVALTNKPAIVGMTPVVNRTIPIDPIGIDLTPLRTALRLDESSETEAIVTAAVARIRSLEGREHKREATRRVDEAFRTGKLAAPQRDWAFALAMKDPTEFDAWISNAPIIVPLGRTTAPDAESTTRQSVRAIDRVARSEWRANRVFLERLCTEDAYAAAAMRDAV